MEYWLHADGRALRRAGDQPNVGEETEPENFINAHPPC